jgi:phosphoglycolate phosphatase
MDLSNIRALIFDLDGTLIDSQRDLVDATNAMLRELSRAQLPPATISSYIGHGAAKLCSSALGPGATAEQQAAALQIFLRHYEAHKLDYTRGYPGVREALESFSQANIPMAVLTNKPTQMSVQILEGLGLARFFTVVYGGDSFAAKKPDPAGVYKILEQFKVAPSETLFIGDSEVDVQTARNAGTMAVTVNHGFGQHDRAAYPADVYVDRLIELFPLVKKSAN